MLTTAPRLLDPFTVPAAPLLLLCGGPDLSVAGRPQRLAPPKRRLAALALAYLLLADGRPTPADELADAAWVDGPPLSWQSSLRRIVSDARAWLRDGGTGADVRVAHGSYAVVLPDGLSTDVVAARTALAVARGQTHDPAAMAREAGRAADLLAAPLMPGYEAPWLQVAERELERDLAEALDLLADAELRCGNAQAAVGAAERAIALDPLRESSYRQAMAAHLDAGRVGAALRTYEVCRRTLAEEIGTSPSPETTAAYLELLDAPSPSFGVAIRASI